MSLPLLDELYTDIRRLAIAGSRVAPGDFRLKKLLDPLRKAGAKAPVFARLADQVDLLIQSNEQNAAPIFLELGALIHSIRYTQGNAGAIGDLKPLPTSSLAGQTKPISARVLKPLLEALSTTGSGRYEQIKDAFEQGLFNDLRLVRPALLAIDDKYAEIRELIADKVLPSYGLAIYDDVKSSYDPKGGRSHGKRLQILHRIAPKETREAVLHALEEGSKEVKICAIECLGEYPEDVAYLLQQAKARSQEVRSAALLGLSQSNSPEAQSYLQSVLDSKDLELLVRSVHVVPPRLSLVEEASQRVVSNFQTLLQTKEKGKQKEIVEQLLQWLRLVCAEPSKQADTLLVWIANHSSKLVGIKSDPGGNDILEFVFSQMATGGKESIDYLFKNRESLPSVAWGYLIPAAHRNLSPQAFYKEFSPYIAPKAARKTDAKLRSDALIGYLQSNYGYGRYAYLYYDHSTEPKETPFHKDWAPIAIEHDLLDFALRLAPSASASLLSYYSKKWDEHKGRRDQGYDWRIAQAMLDAKHPDAPKRILEGLRAAVAHAAYSYQVLQWGLLAGQLGPEAIPELEALIADPKTKDSLSESLLEAIERIRSKE